MTIKELMDFSWQEAEVKVETFPFTKYGTLRGKISQVSSDAIQDEKLGLIYSTRVKLAKDSLRVENKTVRLTPWHGGDSRGQDRHATGDRIFPESADAGDK